MDFHNHQTLYEFNRTLYPNYDFGRPLDFCNWFQKNSEATAVSEPVVNVGGRQCESKYVGSEVMISMDRAWYLEVRPYFKVWPFVAESLTRIAIDIPTDKLDLGPPRAICIRFPKGKSPKVGGFDVHSILCCVGPVNNGRDRALLTWPDLTRNSDSRRFNAFVQPVYLDNPFTVGEWIQKVSFVSSDGEFLTEIRPCIEFCVRVCLTTLLLANDPSIIKPDVLAADRHRFDETGDPKYIEKARKRGIVGWRIGEDYESIPHYRRPHFALRHTGQGRTVPRIVPVKGAVVHREKLTRVPTGYITPDGVEVEP